MIADIKKDGRFIAVNTVQSFPNDLELPLHGAAKLFVTGVVLESTSGDERFQGRCRLNDVVEMGKHITLHKEGPFPEEHAS